MPPSLTLPPPLTQKTLAAQAYARRIVAGDRVAEALVDLQNLYPRFRFFCDENYGLSMVGNHLGRGVPHGLLHALSHVVLVEPNDVAVLRLVIFKDKSGILHENPREVVRLFQVVVGLVPDGVVGSHTLGQMRLIAGTQVSSIADSVRPSVWERLLEEDTD